MAKKNTAISPRGTPVGLGRIGDVQVVKNQNPHRLAAKAYVTMRVQLQCGDEVAGLWTHRELQKFLAKGIERAKKNPEDLPRATRLRCKLRDLLD